MKKSILSFSIAALLVLLQVSALFAQDQPTSERHNLKLAFEFGTNEILGKLVTPERMRENKSSGYFIDGEFHEYGFFEKNNNTMETMYFGVKPEFFIFKNRIGIASGLRFSTVSSKLASHGDKFLWKVKENGLNTDYIQIDDIHQKSKMLSIPLEVRYFINNRELPFQTYFKIGASLNYQINVENQINITNKSMEKYSKLVNNQLSESNNLLSSFFYGAFGFKIGKYTEGRWMPWGNIELHFPYFLLTKKPLAFTGNGYLGAGFQLSFQIPIGENVPIGSK